MPNITSVTLASGIPTAGSGTVSTLDNLLGAGAAVEVVPTVTASAYTAGFVVGGIMTFASILSPNNFGGILESLSLKFKGSAQTTAFAVSLFDASPTGTFADHGAPAINAADTAHLLGIWQLLANQSPLGTHTIYELDGIGKFISSSAASQSLFAVVTTVSAVTPASTTDMSLKIAVAW